MQVVLKIIKNDKKSLFLTLCILISCNFVLLIIIEWLELKSKSYEAKGSDCRGEAIR